MRISMKATLLAAVITAVLGSLGSALAAPPTPYVSATPLAVIIPTAQTQGSASVEWNAGAANPDAELWMKIDNDPETRLSPDALGTKTVKIFVDEKLTFNLYKTAARNTLLSSVVVTASNPPLNKPPTPPPGTPAGGGTALDDLAARGEYLASKDPLTVELRKREPNDSGRRGFDIGLAAAEGHTMPGAGKQKIHDSLSSAEQSGFDTAVAFSLERNRNADRAAKGAAIAQAIPLIGKARTVDKDVFYWLGFDIATGIFGNPALGAEGKTATGPGSLKVRDSLSAAGQRGFNAAVKLHLNQDITPAPGSDKIDPNTTYIKKTGKDNRQDILAMMAIMNVRAEPGSRNVMIRFNGPANENPFVAIGRAPAVMKNGELVFETNLVGGGFVNETTSAAEKAKGQYVFHSGAGTNIEAGMLQPNATYYYLISIPAPAGSGRRVYQDTGKFTMRGETLTVTVVWDKVRIDDDSDSWPAGTGEIAWGFWANYGQPSAKSCFYYNGDMDTGKTYDLNKTVVIENAPVHLSLATRGQDDDEWNSANFLVEMRPCNGPQDTDYQSLLDVNGASGEFDLAKYADNEQVPFELHTNGGDLKFVIFGHFTVWHPTLP
jgi:hypothetical protein